MASSISVGANNNRPYQKLPTIVGSYKSSVTKNINQIDPNSEFRWQKSYHDHIIRNTDELNHIRLYIRQNPEKWTIGEK